MASWFGILSPGQSLSRTWLTVIYWGGGARSTSEEKENRATRKDPREGRLMSARGSVLLDAETQGRVHLRLFQPRGGEVTTIPGVESRLGLSHPQHVSLVLCRGWARAQRRPGEGSCGPEGPPPPNRVNSAGAEQTLRSQEGVCSSGSSSHSCPPAPRRPRRVHRFPYSLVPGGSALPVGCLCPANMICT